MKQGSLFSLNSWFLTHNDTKTFKKNFGSGSTCSLDSKSFSSTDVTTFDQNKVCLEFQLGRIIVCGATEQAHKATNNRGKRRNLSQSSNEISAQSYADKSYPICNSSNQLANQNDIHQNKLSYSEQSIFHMSNRPKQDESGTQSAAFTSLSDIDPSFSDLELSRHYRISKSLYLNSARGLTDDSKKPQILIWTYREPRGWQPGRVCIRGYAVRVVGILPTYQQYHCTTSSSSITNNIKNHRLVSRILKSFSNHHRQHEATDQLQYTERLAVEIQNRCEILRLKQKKVIKSDFEINKLESGNIKTGCKSLDEACFKQVKNKGNYIATFDKKDDSSELKASNESKSQINHLEHLEISSYNKLIRCEELQSKDKVNTKDVFRKVEFSIEEINSKLEVNKTNQQVKTESTKQKINNNISNMFDNLTTMLFGKNKKVFEDQNLPNTFVRTEVQLQNNLLSNSYKDLPNRSFSYGKKTSQTNSKSLSISKPILRSSWSMPRLSIISEE